MQTPTGITKLKKYPIFVALLLILGASNAIAQSPDREAIRLEMESLESTGHLSVRNVEVASGALLAEIYEARQFAPAWTRPGQIAELVKLVMSAETDGLDPEDYNAAAVEAAYQRLLDDSPVAAEERAEIDVLLTDTLIRFAYHLRFGKINPYTLDPQWNFNRKLRTPSPAASIQAAIDSESLQAHIWSMIPRGWAYLELQQALAAYRALAEAGGWPTVPAGTTLRREDSDPRVPIIASRLAVTGDLDPDIARVATERYDDAIEEGVRRFQARHGLDADGIIGAGTLAAMNVPAEARVRQLEINLERARWVFDDLSDNFILVNIAGFRVYVIRDRQVVWQSRVQVGKPFQKTPVFRDEMKYLVFNPTWTVPFSIATRDLLPQIQANPGILSARGFDVRDSSGRNVDPATVEWSALSRRRFPYTLVQRPGPNNALGRLKFMFPNEHAVYLHDTPSKHLFDRAGRAFSAGCIRVEHPFELAEILLGPDGWNQKRFEDVLATGKETTVFLSKPLPVLLLYWTAQVSADGEILFLPDIYERDDAIADALDAPFSLDSPAE